MEFSEDVTPEQEAIVYRLVETWAEAAQGEFSAMQLMESLGAFTYMVVEAMAQEMVRSDPSINQAEFRKFLMDGMAATLAGLAENDYAEAFDGLD